MTDKKKEFLRLREPYRRWTGTKFVYDGGKATVTAKLKAAIYGRRNTDRQQEA